MVRLIKIKVFILISFFLVSFFNCNKDNDIIQDVPVNVYFNILDPEFSHLNAVGNSLAITGGLNGIIVYRVSTNEFVSFERTCTYQPEENCAVENDNATAECPCCESRYFLLDGSVFNGPASLPLKSYRTTFDGTYVRITN